MSRSMKVWFCGVAVAVGLGSGGRVWAQPGGGTKMDKELDTLEGYKQLPGEKGTKKALTDVPNEPVETMIIWSEAKPGRGAAPLKVDFTAEPPDSAKQPTYAWNFGDGSAAGQGAQVSHTFDKPGVYKVVLKVTDASGGFGQDELRIKVTP
jgi:PKD domain-containing protein